MRCWKQRSSMPVLAIDLGTTGCKAGVFDGPLMLSSAYHQYSWSAPQDGWAEQDAEAVWLLVDQSAREAVTGAAGRPPISAICVSVQGDAIIPVDEAGTALHPAILGMDTRSYREATDLEERFGREQLYAWTGMPCEPLNAITKIAWLVRNGPSPVWKYLHYEEYLLMKISGVPAVGYTMASRTMAFNPVAKQWVASVLETAGVSVSQLGDITQSGTSVGAVRADVAEAWGISHDALVVTGGHDQCMAALGAGVIDTGLACYSMGTAEVISISFDKPAMTQAMLRSNYPCYCHAASDRYFTISLNQSGGLSLDWFRRAVNTPLDEMIAGLVAEPSLAVFLPHLVGSGTPWCDHLARGTFLGLSLKTGRQEMFQAVVEALAFEARLNLDRLQSLGIPVAELRAVGGGSRSGKILELKATVLQRPIRTLATPEAALLGAAMLAQIAVGAFTDLHSAARECVRFESTVEPLTGAMDAYSEAFDRFQQVYEMLKPWYHNGSRT
jgi:xylulokinase